jgi:hypothetical protein
MDIRTVADVVKASNAWAVVLPPGVTTWQPRECIYPDCISSGAVHENITRNHELTHTGWRCPWCSTTWPTREKAWRHAKTGHLSQTLTDEEKQATVDYYAQLRLAGAGRKRTHPEEADNDTRVISTIRKVKGEHKLKRTQQPSKTWVSGKENKRMFDLASFVPASIDDAADDDLTDDATDDQVVDDTIDTNEPDVEEESAVMPPRNRKLYRAALEYFARHGFSEHLRTGIRHLNKTLIDAFVDKGQINDRLSLTKAHPGLLEEFFNKAQSRR